MRARLLLSSCGALFATQLLVSQVFIPQAQAQAKTPAERARERLQEQREKAAKALEKNKADEGEAKKNEPTDELPGTGEDPPSTMDTIAQAVDTPYKPKPGGHLIKFNLEDADLAELVNHISGLTGRRFIYGAKVRDIKVTVVSPTPVTLNEAYEVFLSILSASFSSSGRAKNARLASRTASISAWAMGWPTT